MGLDGALDKTARQPILKGASESAVRAGELRAEEIGKTVASLARKVSVVLGAGAAAKHIGSEVLTRATENIAAMNAEMRKQVATAVEAALSPMRAAGEAARQKLEIVGRKSAALGLTTMMPAAAVIEKLNNQAIRRLDNLAVTSEVRAEGIELSIQELQQQLNALMTAKREMVAMAHNCREEADRIHAGNDVVAQLRERITALRAA